MTRDPLQHALAADAARTRPFAARAAPAAGVPAKPDGVDLDALYIQMTPLYHAYCLDYLVDGLPRLCAGTENDKRWPDRGEIVTFTAHFMNKGTVASGPFEFTWAIDGTEKARGSSPGLGPGEAGTAAFQWAWDHDVVNGRLLGRHTVRFALDPDGKVAETYKSNNVLEDRTDATPLGFQMTPEVYAALETPVDVSLPFSAEDWAQKQFRAMNDAFARSVYASAPDGCLERVRINQIQVGPEKMPNDGDIGGWFLTVDDRFNGSIDPGTDVDGPMLHELGHQLGIIDIYHLQVDWLVPHRVLDQNGRPVLVEQFDSYLSGLMADPGIQPPSFDEHTTGGMNANKGYRRGYFGEYMWDTPAKVELRVLDSAAEPVAGVALRLFRMAREIGYDGVNDDTPEMVVTTGDDGVATLPNRQAGPTFTTATGHTLKASPIGPIDLGGDDTFLIELAAGSHHEWSWLDIADLNLLAWGGRATLDVPSHIPVQGAPAPPSFLTGVEERGSAELRWGSSPTGGITRYRVYATSKPRDAWIPITDPVVALAGTFAFDRNVMGFAVTTVDAAGRESGFSEPYWAIHLQGPDGVAVDAASRRFLRQWDSVIMQGGDGRYLNIVRAAEPDHGHLAFDPNGRLLMCRRDTGSVAVLDPSGDPRSNLLFDLSVPAGDATMRPTGITVVGGAFAWGGPYTNDEQTQLLCHFEGTVASDTGVVGQATGISFTGGRIGRGVAINQPATLSYTLPEALSPTQGAAEFWVMPTWRGDDQTGHILLAMDEPSGSSVHIEKDGAGGLRTLVGTANSECGVGLDVAGWRPGDWHHVAVTWQGSRLTLFVDGALASRTANCALPSDLGGKLCVGSVCDGTRPADAVFDELRISDIARVGNSDTAGRIVVADGANDRLVTFDLLGQYLGSYGTPGSGAGQFQAPAGVAADSYGRVAVVDSGNNRVELFSFDGTTFTFIRELAAGLSGANGIALRADRVVIADTGHDEVKVLSDSGDLVAAYDGPNDGVYSGSFSRPTDVAIAVDGRIVVTDTGNNRVVEILHREPLLVRHRRARGR